MKCYYYETSANHGGNEQREIWMFVVLDMGEEKYSSHLNVSSRSGPLKVKFGDYMLPESFSTPNDAANLAGQLRQRFHAKADYELLTVLIKQGRIALFVHRQPCFRTLGEGKCELIIDTTHEPTKKEMNPQLASPDEMKSEDFYDKLLVSVGRSSNWSYRRRRFCKKAKGVLGIICMPIVYMWKWWIEAKTKQPGTMLCWILPIMAAVPSYIAGHFGVIGQIIALLRHLWS